MGKVGMTAILKTQLEMANATIQELLMRQEEMARTIQEQSATIKSLESTIRNLKELLLKKEDALSSAEEQKKALGNPDAEEIGARQYIRYSMIPPKFIKTVYNNIAYKLGGTVLSQ